MPLPGSRDSAIVMKRVSQGSFLQRTVLKHNVLFTEGSKGDEAYILTEGKIEISGTVAGRKKVFAVLSPVSMFGEMALFLEKHARTATAIALEDAKVVVLHGDDLESYIQTAPPAIEAMSSRNSLAKEPSWMRARFSRMPSLAASVMTRGPEV